MRWLAILAMCSTLAAAGEATVKEEFIIEAPLDRVTAWVDGHAAELRDSVNVQLVEKVGEVLTLKRKNNRGTWVWRQRESVARTASKYSYATALVECLEGGIRRMDGVVSMEQDGSRTKVTATTTAEVEDIKSRELEYDLKTRARRIKKVLQEACE